MKYYFVIQELTRLRLNSPPCQFFLVFVSRTSLLAHFKCAGCGIEYGGDEVAACLRTWLSFVSPCFCYRLHVLLFKYIWECRYLVIDENCFTETRAASCIRHTKWHVFFLDLHNTRRQKLKKIQILIKTEHLKYVV